MGTACEKAALHMTYTYYERRLDKAGESRTGQVRDLESEIGVSKGQGDQDGGRRRRQGSKHGIPLSSAAVPFSWFTCRKDPS